MNANDPQQRLDDHPATPPRGVVTVMSLILMSFLIIGCTKPSKITTSDNDQHDQVVDPWVEVGKRLRKETDITACKSAIAQLNGGLASRKDLPQPPIATPTHEQNWRDVASLSPADLEEVRSSTYTALDAVYLADCFYLRDAAKSLDHSGLPPRRRAQVAFEWVCRQVYLNPWMVDAGPFPGQPVPPTSVLRRGYGSGLERAYVLLALFQQMNLDACLIGPPDAGNKPAGFVVNGSDGKMLTGSPKGPFWAVGVRIENDIVLYDPWWSQPLPGAPIGSTATLAQIKADPETLRVWIDSPNPIWGVSRSDVRQAAVFLTVPLSAMSPRMAYLEEKLQGESGVNFAENVVSLRDRFQQCVPTGTPVAFWTNPNDPFNYTRITPEFLPLDEGGRDREPPTSRRHTLYIRSLLPRSVLELPMPIPDPAIERLHFGAQNNYASAFLIPPTPRERIQRGQFHDAARFLTEKQDGFAKGLERLRQANPEQLLDWCRKVRSVYAEVDRARRPSIDGPARPESDPEVVAALNAVEGFWKSEGGVAQLIVDRATSRAGLTESSYLFALAMHEKAEWMQLQAELASATDAAKAKLAAFAAWKEAVSAWRAYVDQTASLDPFPNRKAHAETLAARAANHLEKANP